MIKSERWIVGGVLAFLIIFAFVSEKGQKAEAETEKQEGTAALQVHSLDLEESTSRERKSGIQGKAEGSAEDVPIETVSAEEDSSTPSSFLYVHVDGAVRQPGLYKLREGERVQDAIERAGGLLPEASTDQINLALRLTDEMKICIPPQAGSGSADGPSPAQGKQSASSKSSVGQGNRTDQGGIYYGNGERAGGQGSPSSVSGGSSGAHSPGKQEKININRASATELQELPSIGPRRAEDIIAYREEHPFERIEELKQIPGIGEKTFDKLKDRVEL